jgi:uncharacterized membrane protein
MLSRRPTRIMLGLLALAVVLFIVSGLWKDQGTHVQQEISKYAWAGFGLTLLTIIALAIFLAVTSTRRRRSATR